MDAPVAGHAENDGRLRGDIAALPLHLSTFPCNYCMYCTVPYCYTSRVLLYRLKLAASGSESRSRMGTVLVVGAKYGATNIKISLITTVQYCNYTTRVQYCTLGWAWLYRGVLCNTVHLQQPGTELSLQPIITLSCLNCLVLCMNRLPQIWQNLHFDTSISALISERVGGRITLT